MAIRAKKSVNKKTVKKNDKKISMSAPWNIMRNKIAALLDGDSEIKVNQIDKDHILRIEVANETKARILEEYLPKSVLFGSVEIGIQVWIKDIGSEAEKIAYLLKDTKNFAGMVVPENRTIKPYVCFVPDVVQFFSDDLSDPNSNFNGLMEDIAREVIPEARKYVFFSTAKKRGGVGGSHLCINLPLR